MGKNPTDGGVHPDMGVVTGGSVGSACTMDSQCGGPNPQCINGIHPLATLTTDPVLQAIGIDLPGGYCSNMPNCQTAADCGPGGGCFWPLQNVSAQTITDLGAGLGLDLTSFGQLGVCMKPCTANGECRVGYQCAVPIGDLIGLVPGATLNKYCIGTPGLCNPACGTNATCNGSGQCLCNSGYEGDPLTACTAVNACLPLNPCKNGGQCQQSAPGEYTCACLPGWQGTNCDIPATGPCSTLPCQNGALCVANGANYSCYCVTGFTGTNCETNINDCAGNPCLNGGTCTDGINAFTCTCPMGFIGATCATMVTDCSSAPCAHGLCANTAGGSGYTCTCDPGWSGTNCDTAVNACATSNPCQNGGACTSNGPGTYACACTTGWQGTNCDVPATGACANSPCQNGGFCLANGSAFMCYCATGFSGTTCQTNINDCAGNPCMNGGTCTDGVNSYSCSCPTGFSGTNCELNVNDCASNPCQNGGTCVDGINAYTCQCTAGYSGTNCDVVSCTGAVAPTNGSVSASSAVANTSVTYSCNAGYMLVGSATQLCQANGTFAGSAPTCSAVTCSGAVAPANGVVSSSSATYNNVVNYSCNGGYTLVGSMSQLCQADGTFAGSAPTCAIVSCSGASAPANGTVSATSATYGSQITYGCSAGYSLTGNTGSPTRTCQADGTFSGMAPTCVAVTCSTAAPTNGTVSSTTVSYPSSVTYSCNSGYVLSGTATQACQTNGSFSSTTPTCAPVDCGALTNPANGSVSAMTTTLGSTATYVCNAGFTLNGSATTTCQAAGTWSNPAPTCTSTTTPCSPNPCQNAGTCTINGASFTCACTTGWTGSTCSSPVTCSGATAPANGSVSSATATYSNSVTYSCNAGYTLVGSSTQLCQANGTFAGSAPTCQAVTCTGATAPTNGTVTAGSATFGNSVTYACNAGYTLTGTAVATCQANGTFTSGAPTCTPVNCGALTNPANGSVSAPSTTFGSTATYTCNAGFTLVGSSSTTCQSGGTWSNPAPTCMMTVNPCMPNPCQNSGTCTVAGASFTCACAPGWTGATCNTAVTCSGATAPNNGSVSAATATYNTSVTYACNPGYSLVGSASQLCQANGTFAGSAPTCAAVTCTGAMAPTNGSVSSATATYPNTVTYSCNAGYTLTGSATRACQTDATFAGTAPTCDPVTCTTTAPTNGAVTATSTTFGNTVTYSCNSGYTLTGTATPTCQANGTFSAAAPTCVPVNCGALTNPTNGSVSAPSTTFGATATYTCNAGFTLGGSATTSCTAAGTWSNPPATCTMTVNPCSPNPCLNSGVCTVAGASFTCACATGWTGATCNTAVTCSGATAPANGTVSSATATYNNSVTYACNAGYVLSGSATQTCQADGTFGGTAPTCVDVNECTTTMPCQNAGVCTNTTGSYTCACPSGWTGMDCQTNVNECMTTMPCQNGGTCTDTPGSYTCACAAGWSGTNCTTAVTCSGATAPANGTVSAATATYNNTVTYTCNAGYTLTGSATQTCQANGTFSGSAPTCVATAAYCPALTAPTNGAVTVAGGIAGGTTTSLNATGTYTCNAGYSVSGGATRTCQSGGTWSGAAPTCVAASCGAYTDVVYSIVAGFAIKGTTLGIGNQAFTGLMNNSTTPMWGTNGGSGSTSPFNVPSTFTRGFARIRYTNDAAGNPLHATANLVEMYVPLEFHQTAGATVDADVDHSYNLINNTLSNCGGGDAACVNHTPGISRPCTAGAAGTFTANTLNWGSCTPNPTGANSWSFVNARAVTGAGCATGWNAWGNTRSTSGLVPASGKGDSYQTWNQQLKPFVFNGANPLTATFTMAEMQVPNGTNMSNTWMQVTSSTVIGTDCGTTIGTDLVCNIQ